MDLVDEVERLFKFYKEHQAEFVEKYDGKFIVLVADKVEGAYDNISVAHDAAAQRFTPGQFLVQRVTPGDEAYTAVSHSRIAF
jgi:hypothetical protein